MGDRLHEAGQAEDQQVDTSADDGLGRIMLPSTRSFTRTYPERVNKMAAMYAAWQEPQRDWQVAAVLARIELFTGLKAISLLDARP